MRGNLSRAILATVCCLWLIVQPLCGIAAPAVELKASMGYEGAVTYVRKLPVTITVTNHGADLSGMLVMDVNRNDSEFDRYEMPVTVASGASARFTLPVVLTQRQKTYSVRLMQSETVIAETTVKPQSILAPSTLFVGTLSDDPKRLSYLTIQKGSDPHGYLPISQGEYWRAVPLTADTFPADIESMRFFDILAVDGIDPATLSDMQQQVFERWLMDGGIVLVGGGQNAQTDFSFFEQYTGITCGAPTDAGDISEELLSIFGMATPKLGKSVMTVPLQNAGGMAIGNHLNATRVGDGYVFTAAFALGEKPLAAWLGQNAIWQRALMTYSQARYKSMVSERNRYSYNTQNTFSDSSITDLMTIKNGEGMVLPMVLIGVFVLAVGLGSYFLLKRMDKREWMWLSVPLLSIAASLAMWGLSTALPLRDPIAAHYTLAAVDEQGRSNGFSAVVVSQAERAPMTVSAETGSVDFASTISYHANPDENAKDTAAELRYICTYGNRETITFPQDEAWAKRSFVVRDAPMEDLRGIAGQCLWQGDELVFSLKNDSVVSLTDGVILTDMGYVSVPALLPGQSAKVVMRPDKNAANSGRTRDEIIKDGVLLSAQDLKNYSTFDFLDVYTAENEKGLTPMQRNERRLRRFLISNAGNTFFEGDNQFVYYTFSDSLDSLSLRLNDRVVRRSAQRGCLAVKLSYDPIGTDGTARFLKGSFTTFAASAGQDGIPVVGEPLKPMQYQSFALAACPIFGFELAAVPEGMKIKQVDIAPLYSYYGYKVSLFNVKAKRWDTFKLFEVDHNTGKNNSTILFTDLKDYLNNNFLFARFEKNSLTEDYSDVTTPVLTMEGRVE